MGYYRGDYYRPRGDYYRSGKGDFWGAIRGALGGLISGGPVGGIVGGIGGLIGKPLPTPGGGSLVAPQGPGGGGIVVNPGAILPGGKPFIERLPGEKKYKRIDPTNVKALRRAIRRQQGFMAVVRRTIKGTGMKLSRTGVGGAKRKRR